MLVIKRREGESVWIGFVKVTVTRCRDGDTRLAIQAPRWMKVFRSELLCGSPMAFASWMIRSLRVVGYVVSRKTRREVIDPTLAELAIDIAESRSLATSWPLRFWLTFCWGVRGIWLMLECLRIALLNRTMQMVAAIAWWIARSRSE